MGNWKTGWCVGDVLETFSDNLKMTTAEVWYPNTPNEAVDHLSDVFRFLGNEDSDIVYLYFLSRKRQVDICRLMKRTQPAISYDIKRVKRHVDFVMYLLSVIDEFTEFLEKESDNFKKEQINILVLLFFSTSFTKTSVILNCHQITCRNRFDKTLEEVKEKGYDNIANIFETILDNLNMVKKTVYKSQDTE